MFKALASLTLLFTLILPTLTGAGENRVRLYAFGNSLVNHLSDDPDTNVPVWLARMARADGRLFSMDGQWGFLRDFAGGLPPSANWSFKDVRGAWNPDRGDFGAAGFNQVMITPANFLQHRPPGAAYEDAGEGGASPLTATLKLIDWVSNASPGTRVFLYEGWADMAGFTSSMPPRKRAFAKYNTHNMGAYHDWYLDWQAELGVARPRADITLIPVASVLSRLFTETVLQDVPPAELYLDNAPHGQATLYLLAAMITYAGLFDAPPPANFHPPSGIHPLLRNNYADITGFIWAAGANPSDEAAAQATPSVEPPPAPAPAASPAPARNLVPVLSERLDTGLSDPGLAMGLNGLADWSVQHPFIDLMKTARTWVGHTGEEWGAWSSEDLQAGGHLDADGWPVSLPDGATALEALILTDQPEEAVSLTGRYHVTFEGEGKLRVVGRVGKVSVRNGNNGGEIWFSYAPGEGAVALSLQATDPAGNGNYIHNIAITREAHIPLYEAGVLFNPDWLEVVDDLRAVRFMDWMQTNGSPVTGWDNRPVESDYTYTHRGVPLEVMIRLANEIGADPWFNMPHRADDDFTRRFAEYTRDHLDPRLVAYVEYSNEMWNFIFEQTAWAQNQAMERWGQAAKDDGWMQFAGMRAHQVAGIWADVFGDAAAARLKRVVAVHTGWMGLEEPLLDAPLWRVENPDTPSAAEAFDAYAVTGYFGHELGSDEMAENVRDWIAMPPADGFAKAARTLREGSVAELLDVLLPYHAKVASSHGLELIMYEGGTHVAGLGEQMNNDEMTTFFNRFNYSAEMAVLYRELLAGWRKAGGTLFNAFVDVARPSQYGSWGALRHLDDDNLRWQVLAAHNAAGAGWENRAEGTFLHGLTRLGGDGADILMGTFEEDILIGADGDDVLVTNGGGDYLHGGDGLDIAVLPGAAGDYRFSKAGSRLLATGQWGEVSLFSVEMLQFTGSPGEVLKVTEIP